MDERDQAEALAAAYEDRLISELAEDRRARGAFYTPPELVEWILDRALGRALDGAGDVLDPACGTGHFLVAAAQRVGVRAVCGSDLDPKAVRIARLRLQAIDPSVPDEEIAARVRVADGLTEWEGEAFGAVVGNPPFLGQLKRRTAGSRGGLGGYADTSAAFLHRALDLVAPGGTVALVQPLSVLGARDAGPVRGKVAEVGAVTDLWVSDRPVFRGTSVLACVPIVQLGATAGPAPHEWGLLAAPHFGIPDVRLGEAGGRLGELAVCTADFRDQYYGLIPHVRESPIGPKLQPGGPISCGLGPNVDPDRPPLITSGLIDPATCDWGLRPTRFARREYAAPVVDRAGVGTGPLGSWMDARLVPKVLVAGQGRVIEAVVDERGEWLPSVPAVTVAPHRREDLWRILAVLMAPPVVAHAAARYLGTGLTPGSVKVSARQLAALPLPPDAGAWAEGAELARRAQAANSADRPHLLAEVGVMMTGAYGAGEDAFGWWRARLGRGTGSEGVPRASGQSNQRPC